VVGGVGPVSLMVGEFEEITNQRPARTKRTEPSQWLTVTATGMTPVESLD